MKIANEVELTWRDINNFMANLLETLMIKMLQFIFSAHCPNKWKTLYNNNTLLIIDGIV